MLLYFTYLSHLFKERRKKIYIIFQINAEKIII